MTYSSIDSLAQRATALKGKRIRDLEPDTLNIRNKGNIGNIIEEFGFGIKNNSEARPDFQELGIELKVLPLKRLGNRNLSVKERTKVCLINYKKLVQEEWSGSHARHKLEKILFVFYEHSSSDPLDSTILDFTFFDLDKSEEPLIRSDWERTKQIVADGFAHTLSESQNVILAASRSGAGKLPESQWPEQPNQIHSERARQRSFSLKPSFTKTIWKELSSKKGLDRIIDVRKYSSYEELEGYVLEMLNRWEGCTLAEFAAAHGISSGLSKNAEAKVIRHALGFTGKDREIKELLQTGLRVKTIPCRTTDLMPYECMSFPYQPLGELAKEERFDESDFYTYLQGFIFIPLLREIRTDRNPEKVFFGRTVIWRPDHEQLVGIQSEWERCRDIVRNGIEIHKVTTSNKRGFIQKNNLLGESGGNYIHMRPHARDSDDIDPTSDARICKQSFWFNRHFIRSLISP